MNSPVACYRRSPLYGWLAFSASVGALFSAWLGLYAVYCFIPAVLFACTGALLAWIAAKPVIQVYDTHLAIGRRTIPWSEIASVDHTGWMVPLAVRISIMGGRRGMLFYPGDRVSGAELLTSLRRMARFAAIDGISYADFWGETLRTPPAPEAMQGPLPRPRLLLPDDEREVEQMFQRLKSEGYLESHDQSHGVHE